jgi:2-dehydro-3-deoxyphosphooctonate aldolase (KDO 8-P synthase)
VTSWRFGPGPFLIAGPCVVEPDTVMLHIAERILAIGERHEIAVCFKASFDKANRARGEAPRGPGLDAGLRSLQRVREATGLPVLTDVHESTQVAAVAQVVDVLQIPAFLCRQTDLLMAAGRTGKPVNIKKGQWMEAAAMSGAVSKVRDAGSTEIAVTERGTFFGYGDLVVDQRNFARLREATDCPAVFDATHSVQQPGRAANGASGGLREFIPALLYAAAGAGADGFFLETHPEPAQALSDAATQWPLDRLDGLIERTLAVWHAAREHASV